MQSPEPYQPSSAAFRLNNTLDRWECPCGGTHLQGLLLPRATFSVVEGGGGECNLVGESALCLGLGHGNPGSAGLYPTGLHYPGARRALQGGELGPWVAWIPVGFGGLGGMSLGARTASRRPLDGSRIAVRTGEDREPHPSAHAASNSASVQPGQTACPHSMVHLLPIKLAIFGHLIRSILRTAGSSHSSVKKRLLHARAGHARHLRQPEPDRPDLHSIRPKILQLSCGAAPCI